MVRAVGAVRDASGSFDFAQDDGYLGGQRENEQLQGLQQIPPLRYRVTAALRNGNKRQQQDAWKSGCEVG